VPTINAEICAASPRLDDVQVVRSGSTPGDNRRRDRSELRFADGPHRLEAGALLPDRRPQAEEHDRVEQEQGDRDQSRFRYEHDLRRHVSADGCDSDPEAPAAPGPNRGRGRNWVRPTSSINQPHGRASPTSHEAVVMKISDPAITEIA
jgi:hypothetical protein